MGCADREQTLREWNVATWHPRDGMSVSMVSWTTEEAARTRYEWVCVEWRQELEQLAAANEASGFEGGNEAWYRWNNERTGKKYLKFALVSRPMAETPRIEEQEDGFNAD